MSTATEVDLRLRATELSLHRGLCMLVADQSGLITHETDGFFVHQTRFLSRLRIVADAMTPAGACITGPNTCKSWFTAPAATEGESEKCGEAPGEIASRAVEIELELAVRDELCIELRVSNHGLCACVFDLMVEIGADFADMAESSSGERKQCAEVDVTRRALDARSSILRFAYRSADLPHATEVRIETSGSIIDLDPLTCRFYLDPRASGSVSGVVTAFFLGAAFQSQDTWRDWLPEASSLQGAPHEVLSAWQTAAGDLSSLKILQGDREEQWTPIAGVPKYSALFGRDALVTGVQTLILHPGLLKGALALVGKWTASSYDDHYDAQPGRVLHQRQMSPLALLDRNPFKHYWGDHSASGWFVLGVALHFLQTNDRAALNAMLPQVEKTLCWMERDADPDGDGLYEYIRRSGPNGLRNQYWKDSDEAVLHENGSIPKSPIAAAEVQGLFFAAKKAMASVFALVGERDRASQLDHEAQALKARFNRQFWLEREQTYAMALDASKQPLRSVASDPGPCLAYGIIDDERVATVARRLMREDMFSGWGIRTLSSNHPAFNPLGYHLGTVWPMSNALTCLGMRRYGLDLEAHELAGAIFDAAGLFHQWRLPELFGGHARGSGQEPPGIYEKACSPQAWSSGAMIQLLQALLGLYPVAPLDAVIADPALPSWLPSLELRGLHFGTRRIDLAFWREQERTEVEVMTKGESVSIIRPENVSGRDRLQSGMEKLLAALA